MELIDNTKIACFRNCPRMYQLRHVKDWRQAKIGTALACGSGWHAAMDTIWSSYSSYHSSEIVEMALDSWQDEMAMAGFDVDSFIYSLNEIRTPGVIKTMLINYLEVRRQFLSAIKLRGVEIPFLVPLGDDAYYIGRWDKLVEYKDSILVIEHKTTSLYKKNGPFRESWLSSFSPNSQIDGYLYAGVLTHGEKFKAVWVDAALVHKTVHDGFRFIPVERQFEALDQWLEEVKYWLGRIKECEKSGKWPKNTDRCNDWGRCCPYRDVCRFKHGNMDEIPPGFVEEKWEPYNLEDVKRILEGEGEE